MFIKNRMYDIRHILTHAEREEFYMFCDCASSEFAKYNRLEKVLLFLKYHQGYGRRRIAQKTKISEYIITNFFAKMRSPDRFVCPTAKNKYEI